MSERADARKADRDEALHNLTKIPAEREALEARARVLCATAREHGVPWSRIGAALGVSKQAAQERYAERSITGGM